MQQRNSNCRTVGTVHITLIKIAHEALCNYLHIDVPDGGNRNDFERHSVLACMYDSVNVARRSGKSKRISFMPT